MTIAKPIRLLAFAGARDVIGRAELELDLPTSGPGAGSPHAAPAGRVERAWCANDVLALVCQQFPGLEAYRSSLRLAVNGVYAAATDPVSPGDEVALIPPVAGG